MQHNRVLRFAQPTPENSMSSLDLDAESDDDNEIYALTDPILQLQREIIEVKSKFNYIPLIVNCGWLAEKHLPKNASMVMRITLTVQILDSIHALRDIRHLHYSMVEKMYALAENGKLSRLKRNIGWAEYLTTWIPYMHGWVY